MVKYYLIIKIYVIAGQIILLEPYNHKILKGKRALEQMNSLNNNVYIIYIIYYNVTAGDI